MKFLIGLIAALLMGWAWHGPLGHGEALVFALETQARAQVASAGIPGVTVSLGHHPLSRAATLSGTANDFQRNGLGGQPGLTDLVQGVEGISSVRWADTPGKGFTLPLLAETLILVTLAYLIGLGAAWLLWGRKRREGFA
ncbi:MAG: hypothetical protein E6G94_04435 [Alphaproteobacteria bacterium]|nr:MAG: hypothetical protein E6G94_04435 [Alphaproteobacteria bacterium]